MTESVAIRLTGGPLDTNNVFNLVWPPPEEIIAFRYDLEREP